MHGEATTHRSFAHLLVCVSVSRIYLFAPWNINNTKQEVNQMRYLPSAQSLRTP